MDSHDSTSSKLPKSPWLKIEETKGKFTLHRLTGGQIDMVREVYTELFPHRDCGVGDEKLVNKAGEVPTQEKLTFVGNFQSPEEIELFLNIIERRAGLKIHKPMNAEVDVRKSLEKSGVKVQKTPAIVKNANPDRNSEFESIPQRVMPHIDIPYNEHGKFIVHSLSGIEQSVLRDVYADLFPDRPCGTSDEKVDGKYTFPSTLFFTGNFSNCQEALAFMQGAETQGIKLGDISETLRQVANATRPAKTANNIKSQGTVDDIDKAAELGV